MSLRLNFSNPNALLQKKVKIVKSDSGKSLEKKVLKIEHKIYSKAIIKLLASD